MTASLERRVDTLADAFRRLREQALINERLERLTHVIGDLSQGQRGIAFDVREIREAVAEHTQRFDAVDRRFDAVDRRLDTFDRRFDTLETLLGEVLKHLTEEPGA